LAVCPDSEILVASSAEEFARHTALILRGGAPLLGVRGRKRVERDYLWSTALDELERIVEGDR
jgi:hypothetical protein